MTETTPALEPQGKPAAVLSERELDLYTAINSHWRENLSAPSLHELCRYTGLKSTFSVRYYLTRLIEKGFVAKNPKQARSIYTDRVQKALSSL